MASIDILSWNVNQGGYDKRHVFDDARINAPAPEREHQIQNFINSQHEDGVDTVGLIDTYGWRQRYGSDEKIARHLGFSTAAFIELADDRVDRVLGPGAGLTFATDHPVDEISPLDAFNRQGIRAIVAPGGRPFQVATLYLDDIDEELRRIQLRAVLSYLEDEPTVIMGDLNTLRPNLDGASFSAKTHDLGFRAVVFALNILPKQETIDTIMAKIDRQKAAAKVGYYRRALSNLNQRRLIPELEHRDYHDADPEKHPTFRKLGGLALGVDYVFHSQETKAEGFQVIDASRASDHDAVRARFRM